MLIFSPPHYFPGWECLGYEIKRRKRHSISKTHHQPWKVDIFWNFLRKILLFSSKVASPLHNPYVMNHSLISPCPFQYTAFSFESGVLLFNSCYNFFCLAPTSLHATFKGGLSDDPFEWCGIWIGSIALIQLVESHQRSKLFEITIPSFILQR